MGKSLKITALSPAELAKVLSQAGRKAISANDVRTIADTADIIAADGTINLVEYTSFLAQEVAGGAD